MRPDAEVPSGERWSCELALRAASATPSPAADGRHERSGARSVRACAGPLGAATLMFAFDGVAIPGKALLVGPMLRPSLSAAVQPCSWPVAERRAPDAMPVETCIRGAG